MDEVERKMTDYELHLLRLRDFNRRVAEDELVVDGRTTQFFPMVVDVDAPDAAEKMAAAMIDGWPVVNSWGATYGTTFLLENREAVAKGRNEKRPLVKVSLVAPRSTAVTWFDEGQLGEEAAGALPQVLEICEGVAFVRGPASDEVKRTMERDEIQVFPVPEDNPLVCALRVKGRDGIVAVRSSNMQGEPEEPTFEGAADYARRLGAAMVVGPFDRDREARRERVWSQPILELGESKIKIRRRGNTDPETLERLMSGVVGKWDLEFEVGEEEPVAYRTYYHSPDELTEPGEIKAELLRAAGL
jgi:hypothetical protein